MFGKTITMAALVVGSAAAFAQGDIVVPVVPANLAVPAGYSAFLAGRAEGAQNYTCVPATKGFAWTLYGPQATLFDDGGRQIMTHFLSANPDENGTPRATWQDSQGTSRVWAVAVESSSDPAYVAAGAIPWLLLRVVGSEYGPAMEGTLTPTMFIHRVNTSGGVAPAAGCSDKRDLGKKALVPYTTDYIFYK